MDRENKVTVLCTYWKEKGIVYIQKYFKSIPISKKVKLWEYVAGVDENQNPIIKQYA